MAQLRNQGWDAVVPPHEITALPDKDVWVHGKEKRPAAIKQAFMESMTRWDLQGVEADLWILQRGNTRGFTGSNKRVIGETDDNSLHLPAWHRSMQPEFKKTSLRWNYEMHEGFRN